MRTEEDNLENILDSKNYSFLEGKLKSQFREQALIVMAKLDFERTLPYLKERLKNIPIISYKWKGHPIYYDPFILTMDVIIEDQIDRSNVQKAIDRFKPLTDHEKRFFEYVFECIFYVEPNKRQEIIL